MQVQVFVPIALKPQLMLQSCVQGAWLLASVVVQLGSVDEPPPPAPVEAVPPDPPPAPGVEPAVPVVVEEEVPAAPLDSVPPEPVAAEVPDDVPDEVPEPVIVPVVVLPGSVLLEQPEGAQR